MKDKEIAIIEASIKLFAKKGFDSTSIQEIATECKISKGAFYLYFKSKESLLLAIFEYYYHQIKSRLEALENKNLTPRQLFVEQLAGQLDEVQRHKEFIIMQTREHAIPFNNEVANFIKIMRNQTQQFFQNALLSIYGDTIRPYVVDLTLMLLGIINSYFELIIFNKSDVNLNYLARFILKRMDSLVEGFKDSDEVPIVTENPFGESLETDRLGKDDLLKLLEQSILEHKLAGDLLITLEVLVSEIKSDTPRTPVIQGMLATLNHENSLAELQEKIAEYFKITLL